MKKSKIFCGTTVSVMNKRGFSFLPCYDEPKLLSFNNKPDCPHLTARLMSDVTKITVNGRDYDSIDQMPPSVREIYLQAMAALRESGKKEMSSLIRKNLFSSVNESFTYNGREYKSRDELPPEVQKLFDQIREQPPDKTSDVTIVTDRTIIPGRNSSSLWGLSNDRPERDPKVAWLLVAILSAAVVALLFLLYLAGLWHK